MLIILTHYYKIELYHRTAAIGKQQFYAMDSIYSPAEGEFYTGENLIKAHTSKVYRESICTYSRDTAPCTRTIVHN